MVATYSYDLGSSDSDVSTISRFRLEIGDTNVTNGVVDAIFSDEEIKSITDQEDDFNLQVARLYEVLAANSALYIGKQSFMNNFSDGVATSIELLRLADVRRSLYCNVV